MVPPHTPGDSSSSHSQLLLLRPVGAGRCRPDHVCPRGSAGAPGLCPTALLSAPGQWLLPICTESPRHCLKDATAPRESELGGIIVTLSATCLNSEPSSEAHTPEPEERGTRPCPQATSCDHLSPAFQMHFQFTFRATPAPHSPTLFPLRHAPLH